MVAVPEDDANAAVLPVAVRLFQGVVP